MPDPLKKPPKRKNAVNLYLHFPYCLYKCHYCDFNSYAFKEGEIPFQKYRLALAEEWKRKRPLLESEEKAGTIFFGGGTPSLMNPSDVASLLGEIQKSVPFADDVEITLEANPKTIDASKLKGFKSAGINRLSVGIQSLHSAYLAAFGRIHSADDAREAVRLVADAGFKSWNADLIFGFPGQTLDEWKKDLQEMIQYNPPHLSCYAFTVEEGTVFENQLKRGKVSPPSEDLQAEMFQVTGELLEKAGLRRAVAALASAEPPAQSGTAAQAGYCRYEISNFAHPGHECRHNLNYWNYGEYVGLGAGAVSFLQNREKSPPPPFVKGGRHFSPLWKRGVSLFPPLEKGGQGGFGYRTTNFKEPERYMDALLNNAPRPPLNLRGGERGSYWFHREEIPRDTAIAEFFMMGLRLTDGISKETYRRLFSVSAEQHHAPLLQEYRRKGWLREEGISLTPKGRLFSNQIMGAFLPP